LDCSLVVEFSRFGQADLAGRAIQKANAEPWPGIATLAIGLASLQTVLEEGNKEDWFGSDFIVRLSIIAFVSLTLFLIIEFRAAHPLLNLRLLFRRNFGSGVIANFLLGMALYGSAFVLPIYLARVQGYNAEQIGFVLAWTGNPPASSDPIGSSPDETL